MEGIAPLGTLDLHHAIAHSVKALAQAARAFAFVRHRNGSSASWFGVLGAQAPHWHILGHEEVRYGGNSYTSRSRIHPSSVAWLEIANDSLGIGFDMDAFDSDVLRSARAQPAQRLWRSATAQA
jgi:hypothetical protein